MQITVQNCLHRTFAKITPSEVYTLESGQMCAVIPSAEYGRAREALCGMSDCCCDKVPCIGLGDDGVRYALRFDR